ncbi:MAG: winged helix-turn-helix transcriptional regulator [Candidatus Diapherotrites archaeon]|nr:winged helix-turn-helix transcriptional regulator [Candidatus Diapherotrites archaeon]
MQTIQLPVSESIKKELEKIPAWKAMLYLQENGETSAYQLAKALGWTTGKAHATIKKLEKSKAVKSRKTTVNGRAVKLVRLAN